LQKLLNSSSAAEQKKGKELSAYIQQNGDAETAAYIQNVEKTTLSIKKYLEYSERRKKQPYVPLSEGITPKKDSSHSSSVGLGDSTKSPTGRRIIETEGIHTTH
jgi:hypothetical protein